MVKMTAGVIAVVAFVVTVGAPRAAHAATLTIESGFVVNVGDPADTVYSFGGAGFSVQGSVLGQLAGFAALTSGVFEVPFVGLIGQTTVSVSGVGTCTDSCGVITLSSTPVTAPVFDPPVTSKYEVTVPFTASGHLNVGSGYDLIGSGLLHFEYCPPACGGFVNPTATYIFAAPEPSTLLLGGVALSMALLAGLGRRRRAHPSVAHDLTGHDHRRGSVIG